MIIFAKVVAIRYQLADRPMLDLHRLLQRKGLPRATIAVKRFATANVSPRSMKTNGKFTLNYSDNCNLSYEILTLMLREA